MGTTRAIWMCAAVLGVGLAACKGQKTESVVENGRPLLDGLSTYSMPISTQSPLAQKYFDQGVRLTYAFNHPEAVRAFEAAVKIDPECAMCFAWRAFALGPNINAPMEKTDNAEAWKALNKAHEFSHLASSKEQALVTLVAAPFAPAGSPR